MEIVHTPVLLKPCLEYLSPVGEPYEKSAWMVDSTLGEGGHSNAFLSTFPFLNIIGIDADSVIQSRAKDLRLMVTECIFIMVGSTIFMRRIQPNFRNRI